MKCHNKVKSFTATKKVYACVVSREDHYVRVDGGPFDAEEFEKHPERYASTFSHQVWLRSNKHTVLAFLSAIGLNRASCQQILHSTNVIRTILNLSI